MCPLWKSPSNRDEPGNDHVNIHGIHVPYMYMYMYGTCVYKL